MLHRVVQILSARKNLTRPFMFREDKVTKNYKKCAVAAGIADTKLHDLRRSFSSYLSEAGIPPAIVQLWMGHETYDITQRHYLGTTDEMWRKMGQMDLLKN